MTGPAPGTGGLPPAPVNAPGGGGAPAYGPAPGSGGLQPAPLNAPATQGTPIGVQPGVSSGIDIAQIVIIFGPSGAVTGIFLYSGTPTTGNLIGSWSNTPGTDQWGNPYPQGLSVGNISGPQVQVGALGSGAGTGISFPTNTPDNVTTAGANLSLLYSFIQNAGLANQQIGLLLQGPSINETGFAGDINGFSVALLAGADDGSIPASLQVYDNFGVPFLTFTNPSGLAPAMYIGQSPAGATSFITTVLSGVILNYGTTSGGTVVKSFLSTGNIVFPAGVTTARVQNWASGAGGQWASGPGGGSGEYAEEPALAVTAGLTYTATVPSGGNGGTSSSGTGKAGSDATFAQGVTVLVRAHGAPVNNTNPSVGGSGSTATIHHNGAGCNSASGPGDGGGGGAGSPSPTAAGFAGHGASGAQPGGGGLGPYATGGGGGWGGTTTTHGTNGGAGGAGGGSGGASATGGSNGGNGGGGQIIVTYTVPGGTAIQSSFASAAGTDASGNAYPAGSQGPTVAVQPGTSPSVPETLHTVTYQNSWATFTTGSDLKYEVTPDGYVHLAGRVANVSAVAGSSVIATLPTGYRPLNRTEGMTVSANANSSPFASTVLTIQINTSGNITLFGSYTATQPLTIQGRFPLNG